MNISSSSGLISFFNDITNSLMYVETYNLLAERTTEVIMELPNISHVSIVFQPNIIQTTKITDRILSFPLNGNGQIYGKIDVEVEHANYATNELISLLGITANVVAAVYSRIKKINENSILANFAKETDYAVVIADPDGNLEWVNEGFERLSGYKFEEVKGTTPGQLLQGNETDLDKIKIMTSAIKNQKRIETELFNYTKSGKKYWVNLEIKPFFENGILTHYISVQKDITKIKLVEEELREAKEIAEAANEAKNRFLAITSHEIRTPLNIILGMSKILLETDINETQLKYLRGIKSASQNLLLIINDLLDISKIEAGKLQLENIEFDIKQVTEDAITFQNIKAKEKGIELILENDSAISESLLGDPFRLNQILLNLLTNALKFTEKGSILLRCILDSETETDCTIKIEITDTGIGIDRKKIDTIFESYTQEDISITRKYGGTGLGLTITKQLVDLFDGKISVSSDKTQGTTFTLLFTFTKNSRKTAVENTSILEKRAFKDIKLLLAEDNELNQVIALTYLNRWGINTETAQNGLEALDKIKEKEYDIVLMDIQMPEMDGIKATEIIRNELRKSIPIIALTAHALNEEREKYMQVGFNDYVTKPIDEDILYNAILKHIGGKVKQINNSTETIKAKDKIFNLDELRKISISDEQFIPKILRLFISQSIGTPDKLKTLIENKNYIEIGYTIHQIKPSLNHLSVDCTKDIISKIELNIHEDISHDETIQLTKELIEILNILFEQLTEELKKYN